MNCARPTTGSSPAQIDGVLSHLRRGVRVLADHGIKNIVLVADTATYLPTRSERT